MADDRLTVVIATQNRGKLAELQALLGDVPITLVSVSEAVGHDLVVVEDGATFEENAKKKAREIARETLLPTIADDSGLEVDALGGQPGVRSARFAGERPTDAQNNAALLDALKDVPADERSARFRCVLCLVDPWSPDEDIVVDGRCEGRISLSPRGTGGFGYDPLFIVAESNRTMAEHSDDEKNRISHRARAVAALRPHLAALVEARLESAERISFFGDG